LAPRPEPESERLKTIPRIAVATLSGALALGTLTVAVARPHSPPSPVPSASPSGSPAPLPTATPEPSSVAIPRLEAKIKANPNDQPSLVELAGYYLANNQPQQAAALTQRLLALGNKTAQVYFLDGSANEMLGKGKEATADFEQAADREPTNAQVLLTLTDLYLRENRPADAERIAKRATTFNPTDPRVFENYGLVLAQEQKFDDARTQLEAAAKLAPKDAAPLVLEARTYITQKALALAVTDFDRALAIDPKNPDALLGKARVLAAQHDVKGAIAAYEQLYAIVPSDDAKVAVLVEEYQVYGDAKQNDDALAVLKRGEAAFPKIAAIHIAYGDYDVAIAKDIPAGEAEWKTALGPNRDVPDALTRLGELSLQRKNMPEALGYFKRLTEVRPNDPNTWATLAQVDAQAGRFQDAHDAFRRSFEIAHTPQTLAGVGTSDLQIKNYKECIAVFDAIDKNATPFLKANPQLYYVYGKCAAADGNKAKARLAFSKLKPFVKPNTPLAKQLDADIRAVAAAPARASKSSAPKPH